MYIPKKALIKRDYTVKFIYGLSLFSGYTKGEMQNGIIKTNCI